jgi:adenosylmethionine-8-amino-7-oxononanoate aminotransferase
VKIWNSLNKKKFLTKHCPVGSSGVGSYFSGQCTARGMLIRFAGDIAMMSPPLIITAEEIHEVDICFLLKCTLGKYPTY